MCVICGFVGCGRYSFNFISDNLSRHSPPYFRGGFPFSHIHTEEIDVGIKEGML